MKVLQGKPVFDPQQPGPLENQPLSDLQPSWKAPEVGVSTPDMPTLGLRQPEAATPAPETPITSGPPPAPVVQIRRVECHNEGARMDIYADIHNDSNEHIMLDKILLLGTKRELDTALRPGEARQIMVYSGMRGKNQPGGYAEVQYRKDDGDYFAALHTIRSRQEQDGTFSITEFLLVHPIKDLR